MPDGLTHQSKTRRPKQRRAPLDSGPVAMEPTEQVSTPETEVSDMQRKFGNRATIALLSRQDNPHLPLHLQQLRQRPQRPSALASRATATPRTPQTPPVRISRRVRRTIQRNPLQEAVAPYMNQLALTAKKGGAKMMIALGQAKEGVKGGMEKAKGKVKGKYEEYQAKKKYDEKQKDGKQYQKRKENKGVKGFMHYTFGSDFTFEPNLTDDLEDMPVEIATLQLQIAQLAQMRENQYKIAKSTKGEERKNHQETLNTFDQKKNELQQTLMDQLKKYGEQQWLAINMMKENMMKRLPQDVEQAVKSSGLDPSKFTSETELDEALEIWETMHPIEYRKAEIEERAIAFKNIPPAFQPMRNTVEGQLLSDTKKSFNQEIQDERWRDDQKQKAKEKKHENRHIAKLMLGKKARLGEEITDKEKEKANEGEMPEMPTQQQQTQPQDPQPQDQQTQQPQTRSRSNAISGPRWIPAKPPGPMVKSGITIGSRGSKKEEPKIKDTDKITEDTDKVGEVFDTITKITKFSKSPVGSLVNTISGGTQDDEGILRALPMVPMLGSEVTEMAGSILLIKEGNSAQQELGKKKLKDNIFAVFSQIGKTVRGVLKVVEQFQLSEAEEALGATTTLTDLGVPIVGIITNGAMFVKSAIDTGIQNANRGEFKKLGKESEGDSQSVGLKGALKHGEVRSGELMASAIGKGVSSGLMVIGDIINLTGVGAIVGESIKTVGKVIKLSQKIGETIRDSHRTGKELESRYKAKLGVRGSEKEVFERSGKYASTALLRRAMDGDPIAIKAVAQHGISEKMLQEIKDGKVLFVQARELIMHDWKEKDEPKTIGMKIKEGLDKVKKTLAKLVEEKEEPEEQKDLNIVHFGQDEVVGPFQEPDYDNPEDYEAPKVKKGKLEKVKDTLKDVGTKIGGAPKKIGKAIKGLPGKVGKAVGKMHNYDHKLAITKYQFVKVVKDTVQYGGEKRRVNWVINRILSKDSDVNDQFEKAKEILVDTELWKENQEMQEAQVMLWKQMLEIMDTDLKLRLKYKIKPKEEKEKEVYKY